MKFKRRWSGFSPAGWDGASLSLVASGSNACVLHYIENNRLRDNELLLIDAGCAYGYYNADITTFPVGGKFTPEQKALYEIVLRLSCKRLKFQPGNPYNQIHDTAVRVLTEV